MIPAIAIMAPPVVESADGVAGGAAAPLAGEADGRFATALQQMLDIAADAAGGNVVSDRQDAGSDLATADPLEQLALLLQPQDAIGIPVEAPQLPDVPDTAGPLHWLMLIQASAPNPQAAPILGQQAETADVPLSTFETAVLDPAELLAQLPATEPEGGSRIADVVAATLGDAGASDARASDVPLEPANGESPRAVAGVEQNVVPRSNAESVPRATPPPVSTPLHAPQWSHEFAARVNWLVERGDQMATIRLTPEQLGPVEVRLAIREGEASIWFGAAQAETRAAIEQALPRLRELLAESGLSLADSGVFQQAPRDPRQGFLSSDARRAAMESAASPGELLLQSRHLGLIDDYA